MTRKAFAPVAAAIGSWFRTSCHRPADCTPTNKVPITKDHNSNFRKSGNRCNRTCQAARCNVALPTASNAVLIQNGIGMIRCEASSLVLDNTIPTSATIVAMPKRLNDRARNQTASRLLWGEFGKLTKRSLNHQNKKGRRRFPLSATALDPERLVRQLAP